MGTKNVPSSQRTKHSMFNLVVGIGLLLSCIYLDRQQGSHIYSVLVNIIFVLPIYFQYIKPKFNQTK